MNRTGFGSMERLSIDGYFSGRMEVMQFDSAGNAHGHAQDEVAVCVSGHGYVYIEGVAHGVSQGEHIIITAGRRHFMVPSGTEPLCMMILYKVTT